MRSFKIRSYTKTSRHYQDDPVEFPATALWLCSSVRQFNVSGPVTGEQIGSELPLQVPIHVFCIPAFLRVTFLIK